MFFDHGTQEFINNDQISYSWFDVGILLKPDGTT
jgi:hypothetical protein